jgi:F0F1-type ATP synthase gamma subunit
MDIATIGKKAEHFFQRMGGNVVASIIDLGYKPGILDLIGTVKVMLDLYEKGKIDRIYINDGSNLGLYNRLLDEQDAEDLMKGLVEFVKNVAKVENKNKIILDVHSNLRIYLKYYYYLGFKTTARKCIDNPYWIECEMNLPE